MPTFNQPTPHYASPNIGNYYVGRGYISIQLVGDADFVDCGNCTAFEFQAKPTLLPHFSSRVGVRIKDLVVVTELEATLTMSLEEITARNMAMFILGTPQESGSVSIDMFSNPLIYASLKFTGTNVVGPQWQALFPLVILTPQKALGLISQGSGSWGTIDLQADVLKDPASGQFGVLSATDFT